MQGLGHLRLQLDSVAQALEDGCLGGGSIQAARGDLLPEQAPAQQAWGVSSQASGALTHPGAQTEMRTGLAAVLPQALQSLPCIASKLWQSFQREVGALISWGAQIEQGYMPLSHKSQSQKIQRDPTRL